MANTAEAPVLKPTRSIDLLAIKQFDGSVDRNSAIASILGSPTAVGVEKFSSAKPIGSMIL